MNVIDLLVTIVVVTILVTIVLAIVTYVAYKLRLAREPSELDRSEDGLRYFIAYPPPGVKYDAEASTAEGHATEA
jgi:hypothetical protein